MLREMNEAESALAAGRVISPLTVTWAQQTLNIRAHVLPEIFVFDAFAFANLLFRCLEDPLQLG